MLEVDPKNRYENAQQLQRVLELTRKYTPPPKVYYLVTGTARANLFDQGHLAHSTTEAACEFLTEHLGGDNPQELLALRRGTDIHVLTNELRLVCTRDPRAPVLAIKAVHFPYQPELENQKRQAAPIRYLWQFIEAIEAQTPPVTERVVLSSTLDNMFKDVEIHDLEQQRSRSRRIERRDFTREWDTVLNFQMTQLEKVPKLAYESFTRNGNTLTFRLKVPAPDDLQWPDNAPIALQSEGKRQRQIRVGHLMSVNGNEVHIAWVSSDIQEYAPAYDEYPSSGLLCVYQQEARSALDRQQWALRTLLSGGTVNPRLPDVLLDLTTAAFDDIDASIEFYQPDLAEDKKNAVRQALATQDIFVLQGPPGTGKTTTLAEIILQILKEKPDARILVSSQSNVAVNHVLTRVSELMTGPRIEIVRIGRAEKIGQSGKAWALEQRLTEWRRDVLERTEIVMKELKAQMQAQQRQRKFNQNLAPELSRNLEKGELFLADLASDLDELADYESRITMLRANLATFNHSHTRHEQAEETRAEIQELETLIPDKVSIISDILTMVREYLPPSLQAGSVLSLVEEKERLSRVFGTLLRRDMSDIAEGREAKLLELVKNWRKIFGKQEDFAQPIFERANILAATCLISGSYYLKDQEFDWAIIDEAGRATAPELLVPLVRSRRSIIVGDERQLPPMLDEDLNDNTLAGLGTTKENLAESLFETLVKQGRDELLPGLQMLTVQHRMHPAIGRMISTVFYQGRLQHGVKVEERHHGLSWFSKAVIWFSTTPLPNRYEAHQGQSIYNRVEVLQIEQLLRRIEQSYRSQDETREVAVITPYNAQISELHTHIQPDDSYWQKLKIEIATVDAFQGRDRDIVIYSTVRSNKERELGFLKDWRRLNVALSRAKQLLIIVGDIGTLENGRARRSGNPYQELVRYLRQHPEDCQIQNLREEQKRG